MPSPQKSSLITEYSSAFTSLQAGKRHLIQCGADAEGDTEEQRAAYCDNALKQLIALQEEVAMLQKSARESGISGGLLTIVGQAASQSPDDNGASVLRQLGELVDSEQHTDDHKEVVDPESAGTSSISAHAVAGPSSAVEITENAIPEDLSDKIELDGVVANDIDTLDPSVLSTD